MPYFPVSSDVLAFARGPVREAWALGANRHGRGCVEMAGLGDRIRVRGLPRFRD